MSDTLREHSDRVSRGFPVCSRTSHRRVALTAISHVSARVMLDAFNRKRRVEAYIRGAARSCIKKSGVCMLKNNVLEGNAGEDIRARDNPQPRVVATHRYFPQGRPALLLRDVALGATHRIVPSPVLYASALLAPQVHRQSRGHVRPRPRL